MFFFIQYTGCLIISYTIDQKVIYSHDYYIYLLYICNLYLSYLSIVISVNFLYLYYSLRILVIFRLYSLLCIVHYCLLRMFHIINDSTSRRVFRQLKLIFLIHIFSKSTPQRLTKRQ